MIGRGDDIEVPIAIDVCGDDVMRVEVIERRDLPREGAGVCRPRRKGRYDDKGEREAGCAR